jgi:hypothetical protein
MWSFKQSMAASRIFTLALSCVSACLFCVSASANSVPLIYNFDHTLTGVAPSGPTPWLSATFSDLGANSVQLTLSASGLTGNEFVRQWYFNLNPLLNPASLSFAEIGTSGAFTAPTVETGANAFKPDWDGKYDLMFDFTTSGDSSTWFSGGDSVTFSITGIAGLTARDFLFANTPSAGHDSLLAAANLQTVGETVVIDTPPAVPEAASTAILLGLAMLAIECGRRLSRRVAWASQAPPV